MGTVAGVQNLELWIASRRTQHEQNVKEFQRWYWRYHSFNNAVEAGKFDDALAILEEERRLRGHAGP